MQPNSTLRQRHMAHRGRRKMSIDMVCAFLDNMILFERETLGESLVDSINKSLVDSIKESSDVVC